jgi:hypothetical protein
MKQWWTGALVRASVHIIVDFLEALRTTLGKVAIAPGLDFLQRPGICVLRVRPIDQPRGSSVVTLTVGGGRQHILVHVQQSVDVVRSHLPWWQVRAASRVGRQGEAAVVYGR